MQFLREFIKARLKYRPLDATERIRRFLDRVRTDDRPYCPDSEGDLIYSLINPGARCLETGFGTGSTALYMLHASQTGQVTSVDWSKDNFNDIGRRNLAKANLCERHRLIEKNSNIGIPELYLAGDRFDFIFIDGWKTFDHLVCELYMMNRMLSVNGTILFDDAILPSVRLAIRLLKRHYDFKEIDYSKHNHDWRLRIWHWLIFKSFRRPYRAVQKTVAVEDQSPTLDWTFFRNL